IQGASVTALGQVGTWTNPETDPGARGQFGDIAVGPNGQVMIVDQTAGTGEGPGNIMVTLDPDGLGPAGFGQQFIVGVTNVCTFDAVPAQPNRTIDAETNLAWDRTGGAHNGRVYLVYVNETPDESNDTDIFVRFSDNDGATWSSPVRVNDDTVGNGKSQF